MIPDNSPWQPVTAANVTWGDDGTPYCEQFQDVYYNHLDGLTESQHVFLAGANLPQRWQDHTQSVFCVAETGFGSGLNFLATWQAWDAQPEPKPSLHYIGIEQRPLSPADFSIAVNQWPTLSAYANKLLAAYPGLVPGEHRLAFNNGRVCLDLWWHDAADALTAKSSYVSDLVDAWYLDGFTPSRNQAMWQPALFAAAASLSRPAATLATFTAAGDVRRALAEAGFKIEKRTGFGPKRECIRGVFTRSTQNAEAESNSPTPWDVPTARVTKPNTALVIGAGLAGATTAAALANRGIEVTVIDAGSIADGASANPQGVLYTRLSTRHSNLVDFALQSYLFATQFYANCFARGALSSPEDGQLCGCFAQINKAEELKTLADRLHSVPHLASVLSASQASDELRAEVTRSGYWYPRSGWLSPASVCRALLDNPSIEVLENVGPVRLDSIEGLWRASAAGKSIKTAAIAILATGTATNTFDCLRWLPLQPVRGQTTQLPVTEQSLTLKAVLCHEGYIAPTAGKSHCIGASFGPGDTDDAERVTEHQDNIRALQNAIPSWSSSLGGLESDTLSGKVRFRCASNDYLPVVGQVPDYDAFCSTYASLRKDAGQRIAQSGNYLTGLYVNTAHGSRGLTSTPLAAEWLASEICNEPRPYSRKLSRALSPARFIIRGLNRNRI